MTSAHIVVIDPLNRTLRHYEQELLDTLRHAGYEAVEVPHTVQGEGASGVSEKIRISLSSVIERIRLGHTMSSRVIIVAWPLFGYFDPLTLVTLTRSNRVFIVLHDPWPLRNAYGYSRVARFAFKAVVARRNVQVLYHTHLAQEVGGRMTGVTGSIVPHPILMRSTTPGTAPEGPSRHPRIRVLGQYKQARSIAALEHIAVANNDHLSLEIYGRGWPSVPGWKLVDHFIPEDEFETAVQTSDCVVIPYDSFFQSGVAARCLELGVRVVAPLHEHIVELFGADWPGIVRNESDWLAAIQRALTVDSVEIRARRDSVRREIQRAWSGALDRVS
ncbi:hypothetical protein [Rhodococcus wratislaviensis]|uniref:hypothetical protein n=1 Tax=Rhodococcus wratislaviensis TaxID=44752 RepID=UPI000F573C8F|nr:hypothetical protein [Rhodococcus wratislaviensis]